MSMVHEDVSEADHSATTFTVIDAGRSLDSVNITSAIEPDQSSNSDTQKNTRISRLRRRQLSAGRAAKNFTLSPPSALKASDAMELTISQPETDWTSDVPTDEPDHVSRESGATSPKRRTRQSTALKVLHSLGYESSTSFAGRHTARRRLANNVRGSRVGSDQKWISFLERNNEELMAQISTLATDLTDSETNFKLRLKASGEDIQHLRAQIEDRDRIQRTSDDQHRSEVSSLHSRLADETERSSLAEHKITVLQEHIASLTKEQDTSLAQLAKRDQEILRSKRRNAELAERVLRQRSLEL